MGLESGSGLGMDVGSTGGAWLFKQDDLLLGPVPFSKMVELLYAGEVSAKTPISPHGSDLRFRPLDQVESFRVHLAKAQAKLRVEAQSVQQKQTEHRSQLARLTFIGVIIIAVLLGGGRAAWWLAIHRPWEKQIQLPEPEIVDEMPQIKLASARTVEEEMTYPEAGTGRPSGPASPKLPPVKPNGAKPAVPGTKPGAVAGTAPGKLPDEDEVHSVQQWDQTAINSVVKSNKTSLHRCLNEEVKRQQGNWAARIPIEFTIGNDGRISKLWIDNPDYKNEGTELFKCMQGELKKWKFPSYQGEQANVSLAFQVSAKAK